MTTDIPAEIGARVIVVCSQSKYHGHYGKLIAGPKGSCFSSTKLSAYVEFEVGGRLFSHLNADQDVALLRKTIRMSSLRVLRARVCQHIPLSRRPESPGVDEPVDRIALRNAAWERVRKAHAATSRRRLAALAANRRVRLQEFLEECNELADNPDHEYADGEIDRLLIEFAEEICNSQLFSE